MADTDLRYIVDGGSVVVLDARYWPVVFATWFDEPTESLVRKYFEAHDVLLERGRANREPFVLVTDTFATKQPSAKARRLVADLTNAQPAHAASLTIGSIIVIESAILRGVVTALQWILPRMADSICVATISQAVERSLSTLDERGVKRPETLSAASYQRPNRHPSTDGGRPRPRA